MFRLPRFLFGLITCIIASNFAFADVMCHKDWMFGDIENQNQLIQKVKDDPTSNTNTYRYPSDAAVGIGRSHFDCKKGQSYNECSPAIYNYHADNEAMVNYCDKKITKPKLEPAPKKAETPAKKAEPSEQDKCKDSGGLWEDKKCKHEGDPCTKVYGSGVGTYVKVGNDWKCKLTECKGAGYDIDASDNGYSCTIVGSKKEKKPENPKSEPAGEEAQNSSENNAQIEQIKSEAQQILDAYNKRKEELKSK